MYAHPARKQIIDALRTIPALSGVRFEKDGKWVKPTPQMLRAATDQLLFELWMRGFAVSARTPENKGDRDPSLHEQWRDTKRHTVGV